MSIYTQLFKGILEGCILGIIEDENLYGYRAVEKLNALRFNVNEATVYPTLVCLQNKGCLNATKCPSPYGPMRKYYSLTAGGMKNLREFRQHWAKIETLVNQVLEGEKNDKKEQDYSFQCDCAVSLRADHRRAGVRQDDNSEAYDPEIEIMARSPSSRFPTHLRNAAHPAAQGAGTGLTHLFSSFTIDTCLTDADRAEGDLLKTPHLSARGGCVTIVNEAGRAARFCLNFVHYLMNEREQAGKKRMLLLNFFRLHRTS